MLDFSPRGARLAVTTTPSLPTDYLGERLSELGAHCAVEDEVDCTVDDDRRVPDVAQRDVDVVEYTPVYPAEERQKTCVMAEYLSSHFLCGFLITRNIGRLKQTEFFHTFV